MRFTYAGTKDSTVQRCFLAPEKRFVGFIQKVPGGFRMRRTEFELWSVPGPRKYEVARQLAAASDGAFDISPD